MFLDDGRKASGQKVMLATPSYDCPDASYTFAISRARTALDAAGVGNAYLLLHGSCHVDDARNNIVHEFLQSDCTDLVFLDADVSWEPDALVALCRFDCDIVGGVYAFRSATAKKGGSMPYRPLEGAAPKDGLIEVEGLPAGFMRIRRRVIEDMAAKSPAYFSKKDNRIDIPLIFERTLEDGTRWGGDLNFCNKARAAGARIYAAYDVRLGHAYKAITADSLGAFLRRKEGTTLRYVVDKIKSRTERMEDFQEAFDFIGNEWAATDEILVIAVAAARKADGPIIETGSGLSTVLMAAATDHHVYAIEHEPYFANRLKMMVQYCGLPNVSIVHAGIVGRWYDISDETMAELPQRFAVGLNDGPPRQLGDRNIFFDVFGDRTDLIIADDADEERYAEKLTGWSTGRGREIAFPGFRSAIIRKAA